VKGASISPPAVKSVGGWINTADREAVRSSYRGLFVPAGSVPMGWTGSIASGNAGDTASAYKEAVRTAVNWFRAMAGVPPSITWDPGNNAKGQQAALMFSANRALNHNPPSSWALYTAEAAEAAGNSNICYQYSGAYFLPGCIDAYIRDDGTGNYPVGHRRWILYPQTQQMATGDVSTTPASPNPYPYANALWVLDLANYGAARPPTRDTFVAWPPPGYVPYRNVYSRWSFSYPQADFSGAAVTMRDRTGANIPLTVEPLAGGFGENTIVWRPTNALPPGVLQLDEPIDVTLSGVIIGGQNQSFTYRVTAFNPDLAGAQVRAKRVGVYRSGRWMLDTNGDGAFTPGADKDFPLGFPGATPVRGDWNGDGLDAVGVFADGFWYLDYNGNGAWDGPALDRQYQFGWQGVTPLVGDWNGNGRDTIGIFTNGFWYLDGDGDGFWDGPVIDVEATFGWQGVTPFVGDWNGDGRDKIGVFINGFWYLDYNGNTVWNGPSVDRQAAFGWAGVTPFVGDWNGDGRATIGFFTNNFWYLDADGDGVWDGPGIDVQAQFGFSGATPLVGDWNGNGKDKIGVYRNGLWYLDMDGSTNWDGGVNDRVYTFGQSGDLPETGVW
jgi:hypothetical protein